MVKNSRGYGKTETYLLEIVNDYRTLVKSDSCDSSKFSASLDEEESEEIGEEDDAEESDENDDE
jgi:hypothetical protein